ncbi:MAG TPA: response regulator [Planctomycetota bacterium]|nr:response regulator [Planctomycetota bacterium]
MFDSRLPSPPAFPILFVHAQSSESTLIRMVLESSNIRVRQAESLEEAAEFAPEALPKLILADWDMDGLDGRTLVANLRACCNQLRSVPAILLTDRVLIPGIVRELMSENYAWILKKPIVTTSLPKLILRTVNDSASAQRPLGRTRIPLLDFGETASSSFMPAV